jgi:hypothetical protein
MQARLVSVHRQEVRNAGWETHIQNESLVSSFLQPALLKTVFCEFGRESETAGR